MAKKKVIAVKTLGNGEEMPVYSLHRAIWGGMPIAHQVKNPDVYRHEELQQMGLAEPPHFTRKRVEEIFASAETIEKNLARSRPQNRHERGDAKTSAYIPRPGDNLPYAWKNHSGAKKPSLVLRFFQNHKGGGWKYYCKAGEILFRVFRSKWGYHRCVAYRAGEEIDNAVGKTAKDAIFALLAHTWFFAVDACQRLPLWAHGRVSLFKTVHVLVQQNPKTPLPRNYVESIDGSHMRGGLWWQMTERTPKAEFAKKPNTPPLTKQQLALRENL